MSREDAGTVIRRIIFDTSISNNIEAFCVEEFVNFMIPFQQDEVTVQRVEKRIES